MSSLDYAATRAHDAIGTRIARRRTEDPWALNLYMVDLLSGDGKLVAMGAPSTEDWLANDGLSIVVRADRDAKKRVSLSAKQGSIWKEIYASADSSVELEAIGADSRSIVIIGQTTGDARRKLLSVALDGSGLSVLAADAEHDVNGVIVDRFSHQPLAAVMAGYNTAMQWLDAPTQARYRSLGKTFAGRNVNVYDRSADSTRVLAMASGPAHPPVYYLVDFSSHHADIVGEAFPELANVPLGDVSIIHYKARDGYEIPALLTMPAGASGKSMPLIVMPHGGPESHDDLVFDWWAQFLANRGYAVLQPQFRGSTGFGEAHRLAGRRQWGKLMQDDVTDGVKAMIADGTADPKRICIVGASYGGYAALAGAAFTPDLYACAASVGGVSNLPSMLVYERDKHQADGWTDPGVSYWVEHIGLPTDADVVAKSPLAGVDKVRAPIVLIHGVDDTVVPFLQSQQMYDGLTQFGKTVSLVKLEGEDHWLSRAATRTRMLTELDTFLARYLKGEGTR
jgi:dipeptidyl aminopeptidase/acylaminoacyl peptidase